MSDILTPLQRHRCMSHIHSKATKPEMLVRKWLWAHGQIPIKRQERARKAGHCHAQVQNGDLRQRFFLMKRLSRTEEMYGAHFEE